MQCLSLGNVKSLQPYLLVQNGFCAEKSHPTLQTAPVKAYSARGGPSGKVGRRRTLQSLESKASHGRKTWLKDLSEISMKEEYHVVSVGKEQGCVKQKPPSSHVTHDWAYWPTGMKVE